MDLSAVPGKSTIKAPGRTLTANAVGRAADAVIYYDQAEAAGYITKRADVMKRRDLADSGRSLLMSRAEIKLKLHDLRGALADCDAALAMEKTGEAYKLRAEIEFEMGDHFASSSDWLLGNDADSTMDDWPFDEALLPFNQAVFKDPDHAAPLIARARQRVICVLGDATANLDDIFERNYGESHRLLGVAIVPALEDLDRAVAVEPDSAAAWFERGKVRVIYTAIYPAMYDKAFNYDDIPGDFEHALELAPQDPAVWFGAGFATVTRINQRFDGAFANFMSDDVRAKLQSTRLSSARLNFSRAIVLSPATAGMAHYQRALVELTSPQPDPFALETDLTAALELNFSPSDTAWQAMLHPNVEPSLDAVRARAHLLLARVLVERGAAQAALANLDHSLIAKPDDLNARFERGRLRARRGEYDAAIADLDLVVEGNPSVVLGWLWRAIAHDGQNEQMLARLDLEEATQRDPKLAVRLHGTRYAAENPVDAVGIAPGPNRQDSTPPPPSGTALGHKNAGNQLRAAGDLDGAVAEYSLALRLDPNFADAFNNRAGVYDDTGRFDLALHDYARAIELDPHHRVAFLNRAGLWASLGDTERQLADLDRAVDYADSDRLRVSARLRRSHLHLRLQHPDLGQADAQAVTELDPSVVEAWEILGRSGINADDYAAAAVAFRHAVELAPESASNHSWLAVTLGFLQAPEAVAEVDQAIAHANATDLDELGRLLDAFESAYPDSELAKTLIAHLATARAAL